MIPSQPTIPVKPATQPTATPAASSSTPAPAAKPVSPFGNTASSNAPLPVHGSTRAPAQSNSGGFIETVVQLYSAITLVMQTVKGNPEKQTLVDAIVKVLTNVTKLLKEADPSGRNFVDLYNKREVLVQHSTTIGQEVKSISDGRVGGEFLSLKAALKAISNAAMELLTDYTRDYKRPINCPVCSRGMTEDSILCEGGNSCSRWFHRECVGLYSGSFFHTGWTCGVSPCLAVRQYPPLFLLLLPFFLTFYFIFQQKLKEAEKIEAEKRKVKEEALLNRQKEAKEIAAQKKKWEEDLQAQKRKEEDKVREASEKAEKDRLERLERIKNLDAESKRLEEEIQKMNEASLASTGLSLDQVKALSKWTGKAGDSQDEKESESGDAPVIKREKKVPKETQAPSGPGGPVYNPPIPTVKSVRLSTLIDDHGILLAFLSLFRVRVIVLIFFLFGIQTMFKSSARPRPRTTTIPLVEMVRTCALGPGTSSVSLRR